MEGLNNLIQTAKVRGCISGFQVGDNAGNNLEITRLQYADDTLIFCGATEEQMLILRVIFNVFEAVSGLHINWSFIYPVNTVSNIKELENKLGGRWVNSQQLTWGCLLVQRANPRTSGVA